MRRHFRPKDLPDRLQQMYLPASKLQSLDLLRSLEGGAKLLTSMTLACDLKFSQSRSNGLRTKYFCSENGAEFRLLAKYLDELRMSNACFNGYDVKMVLNSFTDYIYKRWPFTRVTLPKEGGALPKSRDQLKSGVDRALVKMLLLRMRAFQADPQFSCRPYLIISDKHPQKSIKGGTLFVTPSSVCGYSEEEYDACTAEYEKHVKPETKGQEKYEDSDYFQCAQYAHIRYPDPTKWPPV